MANPVKETLTGYSAHKLSKLSASLAYYAIFSMGPIILIAVTVLGVVYGQDAAGQLQSKLSEMTSPRVGSFVQTLVSGTDVSQGSILSFMVAGALLLFGATGVVADMQDSLNTIWGVDKGKEAGIMDTVMVRVRSLLIIAVAAGLILAAILLSAILPSFFGPLERSLGVPSAVIEWLSYGVSLAIFFVLFLFIYNYLPDVELGFTDVWLGALVTAVLFVAGQWAIGFYLSRSGVAQQFGPAGAAVAFLVWVYYSAQAFYIGAEFTRAWYERDGREVQPIHHTVRVRQAQPVR